ncbi:helicase-associated domain-containing protein [Tepidibacillus marianensis]|uniref:helicase-associated domain-containing protein n=1 Tax=Tepidibacillus marianensis TaxID=3131995 RepID=UPI0030D120A3
MTQSSIHINSRLIDWTSIPPAERRDYLEDIIRKSFESTDLLINHIFHSLFVLPREAWFRIQDIADLLSEQLNRAIDREFFYRIEQEIIKPLSMLGIMNYTGDWQTEIFFKMKERLEEEINQFYVQPNFEILVPCQCSHSIRLELGHFATLEQRDQMYLYRITQESVMKGLEMGKKTEEILCFLEQYSAIPLHENMKITINDWATRFGAIQFYDVRIVKCRNEEIANHLKQQTRLEDWIIGEIDSLHLIVRKEKRFEQAIRQLEQLGYTPTRNIMTEKDFSIFDEVRDGRNNEQGELEAEFILFKHPDYELVVDLE